MMSTAAQPISDLSTLETLQTRADSTDTAIKAAPDDFTLQKSYEAQVKMSAAMNFALYISNRLSAYTNMLRSVIKNIT